MKINQVDHEAINRYIKDYPQFTQKDCERMLEVINEYGAEMIVELSAYLNEAQKDTFE